MTTTLALRRPVYLAALAIALLPASVFATARAYQGADNGNFITSGNWSPTGIPASADDLTIGTIKPAGLTGDLHVTLNSTVSVNSITLNSSALPQFAILNQTAGTLNTLTENIGLNVSDNTYNQSNASTNNVTNLNIAAGSSVGNNYNILAGSTASLNVSNTLNVGVVGNGNFAQASGSVSVANFQGANLTLGVNAGSSGTYNLTGGTLYADFLQVGKAGTAVFNISGATTLSTFYPVAISSTSSTATFNDSGGTLSIPSLTISSNGTFNLQTGGVMNVLAVIQPGGTFNVAGGTTGSAAGIDMQGGIVQLLGNSLTLSQFQGSGSEIVQNGGGLASVLTLNMGSGFFPNLYTGIIRDGSTGALGLTLANGSLALNGANTYSGTTTVQAGSFQANATNSFSPNSPVNVTGGTFDLMGFSETIPSLSGTSSGIVNVPTTSSLTIGSNNANSTYAGTTTGNGTINKVGAGALTLNGGGSFSGNISLQGGNLTVSQPDGIPTATTVTFSGIGGQLNINSVQHIASISAGDLNPITFSNGVLLLGAANIDNGIGSNFSGTGSIVKNGSANLTIGFGPNDNFGANSDTSLDFSVNSGTLILNKAPGTTAIAGSLAINGGIALLTSSNQIADTSFVSLSLGTLNLNGFNETIGNLSGTGGTIAVGSGTFTVAENSSSTFSGALSGSGSFVKSGTGNLTIIGNSTFGGSFVVNNGRLILQGGIGGTSYTIANGGFLRFSSTTINAAFAAIQPALGGTVEYNNATVNGGFLDGPGSHTFLANSTFNGTTAVNGTTINQTGSSTLTNFTSGAIFNNNAFLTWAFGTNAPSGILNINSITSLSGFTNSGVMNIAVGASVTNSIANLFLAGGSRTFIGNNTNHGGTLTLSGGTTLEVNGALLVNDGTINGTTDVNYGGTAEGVGTYGTVNVTFGGIFQPGFASSALPGNNATLSTLTGSGTIDNSSTGPMTLNLVGSSSSAFSGPIQNSNGSTALNIQGTSSLTLSTTSLLAGGQSVNTYSGGTTVSPGGSLIIAAIGALPSSSNVANNGAFTLNANSTIGSLTGSGHTTIASNVTLTATTSITQSTITNNGTLLLTSPSNSLITANFNGTGGLTQSTASTTTITGTYAATGPLQLSAGNLTFTQTPNTRQDTGVMIKTSNLSIGASSILDISNHDMIIGNTTPATVFNEIANAFGFGPGGAQITSSTVVNNPLGNTFLAVLDANLLGGVGSTWDNVTITDPNSVIIKYTYFGDLNFDGIVDSGDYAVIDGNFTTGHSWATGDANLDGNVDAGDYAVIDGNFGAGTQFGTPLIASPSTVPEPTSLLLLLALPAASLLNRRRKHPANPHIISQNLHTTPAAQCR